MDRKTIDLCIRYEALTETEIKSLNVEELFELRHDMLELMNKLANFLK